ncbi:MAG: DoxX family protein [Phycisphaerales bacterium]|nr:DoxX family protein [Phycisphaerales bacterium]
MGQQSTVQATLNDAGLLVARSMIGVVGIYHGGQKLFGLFGGGGFASTAEAMGSMGMPLPTLSALAAGSAEFFGGIALIVGLLTRFAGANFAFTMLVASFAVHGGAFGAQNGGMEYPLTLAMVSLAIALTGPGRFSVDRVLFSKVRGRFGAPSVAIKAQAA